MRGIASRVYRSRGLAVVAGLASLLSACAPGPGTEQDPRPERVVPSRGLNSAPLPVVIEGESFLPLAIQQVGSGSEVRLDEGFQAWLGESPLEQLRYRDVRHLDGVVPAGLPEGWLDLKVRSPLGREATVARAYYSSSRRFAQLEASLVARGSPVDEGSAFTVEVQARNSGEAPATAVTAMLRLEGDGQAGIDQSPAAIDLEGGEAGAQLFRLTAQRRGVLRIAATLSGTEPPGGLPVEVGPIAPIEVVVRAGSVVLPPILAGSLSVTPNPANEGQTVTLTLIVQNSGMTQVLDLRPSAPAVAGTSSAVLRSGPVPASADLDCGATRAFVWTYAVGSRGTLRFTTSASGSDATTSLPVSTGSVWSPTAVVELPALLAASLTASPEIVNLGQVLTVTATVHNLGEAMAQGVAPSVPGLSGVGLADLSSGPLPASADIAGGQSEVFTWQYVGSAVGDVTFQAAASGVDANIGAPVSSAGATSGAVAIQRPASLTASLAVPASASLGHGFFVTLTLTNEGEAAVVA
ncbi:MAG: hypothetical protein HY901_18440, partial [Deltaproteobacteria bacterium]|nr:hypothetical protein [Deltaproteobacteria bacterium]